MVLCADAGTAELWWDALEGGLLDVLVPPYTVSGLARILRRPAGSEY